LAPDRPRSGADVVIDSLAAQGVQHVFGIPGAKVDGVFDVLVDRGPQLVVCRHEQNAAFMAAAVGRLTGRPGVCLVTSGPGASNLVTGLLTATTEGDPVVALIGAVPRAHDLKRTHQSVDTAALFTSFAKYSVEVEHPDNVAEAIATAFQQAMAPPMGAAVVSLPYDVMAAATDVGPLDRVEAMQTGAAPPPAVERAAVLIREAAQPVLLLGARGGAPEAVASIRALVADTDLPVVETFQSAGAISRELVERFFGRVGIFRNQVGDTLLAGADVIVAIGYDPFEYDPELWNVSGDTAIVHIDELPAALDAHYQPDVELVGNIAATVDALRGSTAGWSVSAASRANDARLRPQVDEAPTTSASSVALHPTQIVAALQGLLPDDAIVACDIGAHYVWMARHFRTYEPRRLLFSNGQQTLGVALPWAIAATLVEPGRTVVSISGDGGFGFSAYELETAVRLKSKLVHLVWCDGTYGLVAVQQVLKYGRSSGTDFGPVDFVRFAESFGATGMHVSSPDELTPALQRALDTSGPVIVSIPVDYSDNLQLFAEIHDDILD